MGQGMVSHGGGHQSLEAPINRIVKHAIGFEVGYVDKRLLMMRSCSMEVPLPPEVVGSVRR
jgi:hypothetical protein